MIKVDLSPTSPLDFDIPNERGLTFEIDWGENPFFRPIEPYRLAASSFQEKIAPLRVKSVKIFPLTSQFFLDPLTDREKLEYEGGRIDLFRRDLLSDFLNEVAPLIHKPLHLKVEGPLYWLHPSKFPWIARKKGKGQQGLLLPEIETDRTLATFDSIQLQTYRLVTEETLSLEWEGLEELWFVKEGVSPMGWRTLAGFAAAGGELKGI